LELGLSQLAEIELSALSNQCLDRRIADLKILTHEVNAWENERNSIGATVHLSQNFPPRNGPIRDISRPKKEPRFRRRQGISEPQRNRSLVLMKAVMADNA
jgi:hypothetical protein